MLPKSLRLQAIVSKPFQQNTFIAYLDGRTDCIIVDPGFEPDKIIQYVETKNLRPDAFLITHGHSDHIAGNAAVKERWPDCPLVIGANEAVKLTDPRQNLSAQFGAELISPAAEVLVKEGDIYSAAGFDLLVREIPGHSSGHVVFIWQSSAPQVVFGGDVLFDGSIGRTDFPDGDFATLERGIREKLYTLPDDTVVLPGHGAGTTIGREKRSNPFVPG
ncbi:MAG TPA: MBL fold metallo-hydrolase [Pirellulales bacterium]|nr:MBL fold metallo-hydrolase [Pirellulales bacterium]